MPAKVVYQDAQGRNGTVVLGFEPAYVGRAVECAVRTEDAMVSRRHSVIKFENGVYVIEDLGSSNGTEVNNVRVNGRQALQHNDAVRCGSLWLRFVVEGSMQPAGMGQPVAPQPMMPQGGGYPGGMQPQMAPPPMVQPPQPMAQPQYTTPATPPAMQPRRDLQFDSTMATPATPAQVSSGLRAGMPGNIPGVQRPSLQQPSQPSSVVVDMGGGASSAEVQKLRDTVDELRKQVEDARSEKDKEIIDNKQLKVQHANFQRQLEDARVQLKENEEVIDAHKRVAEEIRYELDQLREDHSKATTELTEAKEDLTSRTRQLQRAQEDVEKVKKEMETSKRQIAELSKVKDDGFKKLNDQLAEVEHLREVIREQERMLEERRVGLINFEESLKELRQEREARQREIAQIRAERDELRVGVQRQNAAVQGLEEENRRIARLINDLEAGGTGGDSGEVMRLSGELREMRVEVKKAEAERARMAEGLERAERRAEKAETDKTRLEVEGSSGGDKLKAAETARQRADDARAKAEVAKQKADDQLADMRKQLEAQHDEADAVRRELEQLRRKLADIEFEKPAGGAGDAGKLSDAEKRIAELQEANGLLTKKNKTLSGDVETMEKELKAAKAQAAAAPVAGGGGGGGGGGGDEIKEKANEAASNVNDVLSELRVNLSVVRDEFQAFAGNGSDARIRTILDAIEAAAGQAEDMKGVLRSLREL
jgi:DNA repair exonuclease SbcCD ATPase subunit